MKSIIIKSLWAGILTLTVVGFISNSKESKVVRGPASETKIINIVGIDQKEDAESRKPAGEGGTIVFNYNHKGKLLKLSFKGVTWEVALKEGAHKCIDYYTDGKRAKVDEELYLDLIDVCVNPR